MLTRIRTAQEEHEGGFTLIELLVVVIIIGILSAIAIPTYLNQQKKAKEASVKADVQALATNVQSVIVDTPDSIAVGATGTVTPTTGGNAGTAVPGRLSPGNTAGPDDANYDKATGSYCVQVKNDDGSVPVWSFKDGQLTLGACPA